MKIEHTNGLGTLYFKLLEASLNQIQVIDEVFELINIVKLGIECYE
jgi:hypothetical protein